MAYEQHQNACRINNLFTTTLQQPPPPPFGRGVLQRAKRWISEGLSDNSSSEFENSIPKRPGLYHSRKHLWTMTHSHHAAMGGFAIDYVDSMLGFMPPGRPRLLLTEDGLRFLAEKEVDLIPDLSKQQILDKSNASGLAKVIVCMQATWFCVQCIFRLSTDLSISLLELNTFGHSLYALLIYWLWWDKPLDVEEPTLLSGTLHEEFSAFLFLYQLNQLPSKKFFVSKSQPAKRENMTRGYFKYASLTTPVDVHSARQMQEMYQEAIGSLNQPPVQQGYKRMYCGQVIHNFTFTPYLDFNHSQYFLHIDLNPGEVNALMLANQARVRYEAIDTPGSSPACYTSLIVDNRIRNRPNLDPFGIMNRPNVFFTAGFSFAGFTYGGLHLTAWNAPFPTYVERILWRVSALTLTCSGPAYFILLFVWDPTDLRLPCGRGRELHFDLSFCIFCLYLLAACLYCFARVYLVIECFLNLAHLPESAFVVPSWSQYIPHIV
jgi:hypothetical protein